MDESNAFPTGATVPFPYERPYPQQVALMETLLKSLKLRDETPSKKDASILLLESPTGTGKSLSLACASLAWLRYKEREDLRRLEQACTKQEASGLDWIDFFVPQEQVQNQDIENKIRDKASQARSELNETLSKIRVEIEAEKDLERRKSRRANALRASILATKMQERRKNRMKRARISQPAGDKDLCVDDYHSADEQSIDNGVEEGIESKAGSGFSLIDGGRLDGSCWNEGTGKSVGNVKSGSGYRKIIYAARTHSQLSQFIGELKRTVFKDVRVVALGGRKSLCGNTDIRHKSERIVNERCLDMQASKTSGKKKLDDRSKTCHLLSSKEAIETFATNLLVQPTDIEETAALGEQTQTCAYYASRKAIASAEVVVLPYTMLLSQATRNAVGLSLKESLVLVDEAHNLPEVLRSLHSCRLPLSIVKLASAQHTAYVGKYTDRLAGRNLHYLGQIKKVLLALEKHLSNPGAAKGGMLVTPGQLLIELKLDNVNLFKILRYLQVSRLSQKLLGFMETQNVDNTIDDGEEEEGQGLSKHISPMSIVETFLEKLCHSGKEGKIVTDWPTEKENDVRTPSEPALRYVLLSPSAFFDNVKEEAFALALVGGTLRPFLHVTAELLGEDLHILEAAQSADSEVKCCKSISFASVATCLTAFSCDHVVSPSNVLLRCIAGSERGTTFDFRHQNRYKAALCEELGAAIVSMAREIPCGMVVFLPSYSYEAFLIRHWKATGIWERMGAVKKLHREPKSSKHVEASLAAYAKDAAGGALLFSVIGGKMSEGINFANDMARGVLVIGLPYPDITDPELKEKMKNLDDFDSHELTGQSYYHNLCMRAVNQSVGRAIRHANDYATIILVDNRYSTSASVWESLPSWMKAGKDQKDVCRPVQHVALDIRSFFQNKDAI